MALSSISTGPVPMEYPSIEVEKFWNAFLVTINLPNSTTRPPRYIVQTLDEVFEILKKYFGE